MRHCCPCGPDDLPKYPEVVDSGPHDDDPVKFAVVSLRAPVGNLRTLADLNWHNLRRFASNQTMAVESPPGGPIIGGSTAMGDQAFPAGFVCPDTTAYQFVENEDNVLLELAGEKVLGCPPPYISASGASTWTSASV